MAPPPEGCSVSTGGLLWLQLVDRFEGDDDLGRLEQRLRETIGPRSNEDLLLLELNVSLSLAAAARLQDLLERHEARLLRLKLRDRISLAPDPTELPQLTERAGDPLVARMSQRLQRLIEDGEQPSDRDGTLARLGLRELHRACVTGRAATGRPCPGPAQVSPEATV